MRFRSTTHNRSRLPIALLSASVVSVWLSTPAAAQYSDESAAVRRCSGELEFMISRDHPGRNPQARIDDRRTQIREMARGEFELSGSGDFMRDTNDRGRPFTFRCRVDARSGRVDASYQWSGRELDSEVDRPDSRYPPSPSRSWERGATRSPEGRVSVSGGILSRKSGKGLDVQGRSTSDGASIQQWPYGGSPNQSWDIIDLGRGEHAIVSQGSEKVLDVTGREDGSKVVQNRWTGGDTQRWRMERADGGFYQLVNVGTGKCLDVSGQSTDDGAPIQMWSCSGADNQAWRIESK